MATDVGSMHPTGMHPCSKFHFIQSLSEIFEARYLRMWGPIISCLKCTVNSKTVNSKFHQFKRDLI